MLIGGVKSMAEGLAEARPQESCALLACSRSKLTTAASWTPFGNLKTLSLLVHTYTVLLLADFEVTLLQVLCALPLKS